MSELKPFVTAAMVEQAMNDLWNAPRRVCWPHVTHPRYRGWHAVLRDEPTDSARWIICAMCGESVLIAPPRSAA